MTKSEEQIMQQLEVAKGNKGVIVSQEIEQVNTVNQTPEELFIADAIAESI